VSTDNPEKVQFRNFISDSNTLLTFLLTLLAILVPSFQSTDFLRQLLLLEIDGLLLYQATFALSALLSAFLILFIVNRLVSMNKSRSNLKKYCYYTFVFVLLGSLSLSLREFYAPSSSFSDYFLKEEGRVNYSMVQVEAGIEFEVDYCTKSGSQVVCNLEVRNVTNEDLEVDGLNKTRMLDQENSNAKLERVHYANEFIRSSRSLQLTRKSSASLKLFFKYPTSANIVMIKKLSFDLDYSNGDRVITFRNVPITVGL
jgi:hypothetical protein